MICKDLKYIAKDVKAGLGDDTELITKSVFHRAIKELQKQGKHYLAAKLIMDWNKWLFDIGVKAKAPDRIEVSDLRSELKEIAKGLTEEEIQRLYQ